MFMLFFGFIQSCFLKRFHADHLFDNEPIKAVNTCKLITFSVEIIYLIFCKNLIISVYQNIFIIFGVALFNALLGFYAERTICFKSKLEDIETLIPLCKEAKLTPLATNRMVMRYVEKKTLKEIADKFCNEILLLRIDGHLTTSVKGTIYDIWDCSNEIVTDFWVIKY